MTSIQLTFVTYYYLKDLNHLYFAFQGLPYVKEDQTLLINNDPSKAI
jgi:hypothetical protein